MPTCVGVPVEFESIGVVIPITPFSNRLKGSV